jgi:isoleucyl-tRNA synthetase
MKFKSNSRRKPLDYEKAIENYWQENKTFEKSIEQRSAENSYVFYDGPPFITGVPHFGTLLSSIIKDAVPRYHTMKGKRVERVWGWDSHGLPAENFTEKHLGGTIQRIVGEPNKLILKSGAETREMSLEEYINTAKNLMKENSETWKPLIDRVGRWVDFDGSYKTMDRTFMESVWWAFKKLYDAGKIYEGAKVLMYDTKFATPVSKNEVTMDNDAYREVTDPSVYVKFRLAGEEKSVLAWTTTPWTLPANMGLAVNPAMMYSEVKIGDDTLIIAKDLLASVLKDEKNQPIREYQILREFSGKELVGKSYEPLLPNETLAKCDVDYYECVPGNAHKIWAADYVSAESGTGIVHLAPVYGEEDFELAKANKIPIREVLDENGFYLPEVSGLLTEIFAEKLGRENYQEILQKNEVETDENGRYEVWSVNKLIAKTLPQIWKVEYVRHEYPFNPRSKQRIMYRAIPSWFFDITNAKSLMLEENEHINWFPEHLKHGRFAKNIEQAPDWNLSRDRFWATAMPVWKGDRGGVIVVDSYAELHELSGKKLDDYHRPWVDEIPVRRLLDIFRESSVF